MILKQISFSEAKNLKLASCQRQQSKSHINGLVDFFKEKGEYCCMPILINGNNEIIDGGHRTKAYIESFEKGYIKGNLLALVDKNANTETFLNVNKGKAVSLSHKLKLNSHIEYLTKYKPLSYKTSSVSISYVDFGKGLVAYNQGKNNLRLSKPSLKSIESELLKYGLTNIYLLQDVFDTVYEIKNFYFSGIKRNNKKFVQKLFQYFCYLHGRIGIDKEKIDNIVARFPNSLGGDLTFSENLIQFIEIYNFKKRKDKIDLITFQDEKEIL